MQSNVQRSIRYDDFDSAFLSRTRTFIRAYFFFILLPFEPVPAALG